MAGETKYLVTKTHLNTNATGPASNSWHTVYSTIPQTPQSCFGGKLDTTLTSIYVPAEDDTPPVLKTYFCGRVACLNLLRRPLALRPEVLRSPSTPCAAYIGFSMGGQPEQAYHMATIYPEGRAGEQHRISRRTRPQFGALLACVCMSRAWFRERSWETLGFRDLEAYLQVSGDVYVFGPEKGDLEKALGRIKAKVLLMPSRTDMYSGEEVKNGHMESIRAMLQEVQVRQPFYQNSTKARCYTDQDRRRGAAYQKDARKTCARIHFNPPPVLAAAPFSVPAKRPPSTANVSQ
ncbi:hypothetical protein GGX14DRAFT_631926 [Mycena pura]|uniref:Uncharacterized protein n=1 Tax=Mycena pura TaxID=153505 RepID=A0AAD6VDF3_9AGAR|nr:hypothetical protein GGX14DRAFT_631926 [Mycena pura]